MAVRHGMVAGDRSKFLLFFSLIKNLALGGSINGVQLSYVYLTAVTFTLIITARTALAIARIAGARRRGPM